MESWKAEPIGAIRAGLGEGPVWDAEESRLIWIDIKLARLYETDITTGRTTALDLPGSPGCAALTERGDVVLAIGQDLMVLSSDGALRAIASLPKGSLGRFNDGKPDAAGRLWVGTATADGHFDCCLWRYDDEHGFSREVPDVSMSNGIGWSPDDKHMYYVDSVCHRVDTLDFDSEIGVARNRRPFSVLPDAQLPDGLCVDVEGNIWLAVWGESCVVRISPSGEKVGRVEVPTPLVTSCAFGGDGHRTLFITSASEDDSDPNAGRLYAVDVGSQGLPAARMRLNC
ncbi:SMP-30/gluconolactonase/LRE family protein [Flavimaricola marinus]|uniref:L-arabinolactonase n=1 Tax=Flavimaricola marinus TaxID=1819565 RepID=A0A238LH89_9RHOB|nr:SMP-30/gluconolactonase/LRE family protein [Flavimaricola marinus]SMY08903.1 L-arabinolactonase [Flavimaricola marinus]